MGSWIRGGEPPDEIKVTFVVNSRKDPELAEWLWGLPYRGTSASVRDILSAAARMRSQPVTAAGETDALRDTPAPTAAIPLKQASPPPSLASLAPHSTEQTTADAPGQAGMTDAVAKLMREMDSEF